jgi:C4-dicarboxylate-specific signal transduction histidine kinase
MSERINRERRRLVSRLALALTAARLEPVGAAMEQLACAARPLAGGDLQKHRILVQVEPNKQLPEVRGNRVLLQQVLLNLIMNAIDAMAAKDEPRILSIRSQTWP